MESLKVRKSGTTWSSAAKFPSTSSTLSVPRRPPFSSPLTLISTSGQYLLFLIFFKNLTLFIFKNIFRSGFNFAKTFPAHISLDNNSSSNNTAVNGDHIQEEISTTTAKSGRCFPSFLPDTLSGFFLQKVKKNH